MDYVVGSVAALISGNVTPNRPKLLKRALTPIKHQPSPNVTPKSQVAVDRSIFLSPTLQKKKDILKKSPKRIFQNVDDESESNTCLKSPKVEKVKKHLQDDLDADAIKKNLQTKKTPKNKPRQSAECSPPEKLNGNIQLAETFTGCNKIVVITNMPTDNVNSIEGSSKKKRNKRKSNSELSLITILNENADQKITEKDNAVNNNNTNINMRNKSNSKSDISLNEIEDNSDQNILNKIPKKNRKKLESGTENIQRETEGETNEKMGNIDSVKNKNASKKKRSRKKKSKAQNHQTNKVENDKPSQENKEDTVIPVKQSVKINPKVKKENYLNPNAITNKDTDSEHESDNEIESETEENNKEVLETEPTKESSDEEESKKQEKVEKRETWINTAEEMKRTLFVGNVPFNKKCKKEIKKVFNKHGHIESVRIRNVPVKDPSVNPKLAVIKNELHPERSTVNVYIKYTDPASVEKALVENNVELNGNNLRVSKSDSTGAEHDPKCSIFVGNVPFALEDNNLRAKFEQCGEIVSVRIIRDKNTNAGKGFGYVNFASKDGVELALALTEEDLMIKNRIMRVKRCTQLTQKSGKKQNYSQKQAFRGRNQGFRGRNQGFRGRNQGFQGRNQDFQGKNQDFQGRNQGFQGRNQGTRNFDPRQGQSDDSKGDGAYRRIMHKRENQDAGDGPPNKIGRYLNQPIGEKKVRKEFVGMTAEKKKKHKFDKGLKQKKILGEILTK